MYRSLTLFGFAALASGALSQGDPAIIDKILDEGKNRNQVMSHLRYLTQNIGHRLTGSNSHQAACDWTMTKFKEYGLTARLEQWGEIPVGFQREQSGHVGRMVSPVARNFEFTTRSWTPGTPGLVKGRAVMAPANMAEIDDMRDKLNGAWVIMRPQAAGGRGRGGQRVNPDFMAMLRVAGIAGTVSGTNNELVITSGSWQNLDFMDLPRDVGVTVRKSDYDAIVKEVEAGKDVQLEFNLQQKFLKGPIPVYNVIADIPGTEKPEEIVIVSGHLDSWDGPGTQGTCDNGTGTMVALEAARILMKTGAKPKRTIRFIMWTGEEQGLHGSRRYVEMHKDNLSKISAVLVDDGGTNYSGGLVCIAAMEPMLRAAITPVATFFADMPVNLVVRPTMPRGGGSDHAPFNAVGVPGFFWNETGRANYQHIHHTQNDKFSEAIPEYLVQSSTVSAVVAYNLAMADTLLPRQGTN